MSAGRHGCIRVDVKQFAGITGLARSLKQTLAAAAFNGQERFRRRLGGRREVRIDGQVAFYDVFAYDSNSKIVCVGHYGRRGELNGLACAFPSGRVSDPPDALAYLGGSGADVDASR